MVNWPETADDIRVIATSADLVARYRARFKLRSSYQVAKALGVTVQAVRHWELGQRVMGTAVALRVAEELNLDAGALVGRLEAERVQRAKVSRRPDPHQERRPSQRRLGFQ